MALLASAATSALAVTLDFTATVAALVVATLAWRATRDQAIEARRAADEAIRATSIANRPLLVPHVDDQWPSPRVVSSEDMQGGKLVDVRKVLVRLKNVGRGPALLDSATLTCAPGSAALQGVMSIGPGEAVTLEATFVLDQQASGADRVADGPYEVIVDYDDIFEAPGGATLKATFDPESGWRTDRRPGVSET